MLLYQEQGICYSLHGRRRTLLTERHIRKKSNATMPRLLGRFWRHHVPYHLDWWTLTSQSWNHSPAIQSWIVWRYVLSRAGPHIVSWSPPQHSHQSWMIAKALAPPKWNVEQWIGLLTQIYAPNQARKSAGEGTRKFEHVQPRIENPASPASEEVQQRKPKTRRNCRHLGSRNQMQKSLPSQDAFFAPLKKTAMKTAMTSWQAQSFFHPISNGRIELGGPPQCNHCTACNIFLRLDLIWPNYYNSRVVRSNFVNSKLK